MTETTNAQQILAATTSLVFWEPHQSSLRDKLFCQRDNVDKTLWKCVRRPLTSVTQREWFMSAERLSDSSTALRQCFLQFESAESVSSEATLPLLWSDIWFVPVARETITSPHQHTASDLGRICLHFHQHVLPAVAMRVAAHGRDRPGWRMQVVLADTLIEAAATSRSADPVAADLVENSERDGIDGVHGLRLSLQAMAAEANLSDHMDVSVVDVPTSDASAQAVARSADAVIIGSRLIQLIEDQPHERVVGVTVDFLRQVRKALDA